MVQGLFGLQPESRLSWTNFTGFAALCLGMLSVAGTPARSQEAAVTPDSAISNYTTFEAPGAGTGEFQGTGALAINASGAVVGVYADSKNLLHGYVRSANATFTSFDAKDAGTGAYQGTIAVSINASGAIAGTYLDRNGASHGFVRAGDGTITEFDAIGAGTAAHRGTVAVRINDAGAIAGFYTTGNYLAPSMYHGFLRAANGTITAVDDPNAGTAGGPSNQKQGTMGIGINANGEIVGTYKDTNTVQHGFVRSAAGLFTGFDPTGVGTCVSNHGYNFGGTSASDIDAAGDVAGYYTDTKCVQHGFVRAANGQITPFDAPGADLNPCATSGMGKMFCGTLALGIDTAGAIAGSYADTDIVLHGFVRSALGGFTKLDAPGAATTGMIAGTVAFGINDVGTVVGTYIDVNAVVHGFIYTPPATPPAPTTTSLKSSLNPSVYLEPVTFTAKVASSSAEPPNGESVSFIYAARALGTGTLSGGSATTTTTALPVGTDSITATYAGDASFANSKSAALSQVVNKAKSNTALTAKPNPSSYAQPVTLEATVTGQFGGTPTGTVTFSYGTTKIGTAPLSKGTASLSISTLPLGADSIAAVYSGDKNFLTSTSNTVKQVVNQAASTTALTSSLNPSKSGQSVTFTATVTGKFGGSPSGSVAFNDGTKLLKTVTLNSGAARYTTTTLTSGTHSIKAVYSGDTSFKASSASLSQKVN